MDNKIRESRRNECGEDLMDAGINATATTIPMAMFAKPE
ncbi:hypothetical protein PF005_g27069 [Phytophthora fragariae]|uniref:Uncharacterized protein n=2 Tax=Phytophthora TaxID=4783 RepID=A0A6A3QDX6_9STRA|nr:hypothetical protein PF003_g35056 [Phytophthora fragariae]KAE8976971.1 hypothetical protein PR001_g25264 [Phytophthora rubi]KAE8971406.1 hypothetical protein PF011_g26043 [Phytophthora fragariae]KAE9042592.1 hypothetical protein PR002_g3811 [Phytophthora rubi]KAE9070460.1 hypothetical protein PF010_g26261 [Phytophthora fragariae]